MPSVALHCRLMTFDPTKRMTAAEGLEHPYCAQFHDAEHCPVALQKVQIPIDDNDKKTTSHYREKLYLEITKWKKGGLPDVSLDARRVATAHMPNDRNNRRMVAHPLAPCDAGLK